MIVVLSVLTAQAGQQPVLASSPGHPQIVERIDDSQLTALKGNVHPAANSKNDRGHVASDLPMTDLILVLKRSPEQQKSFDAFVASQYDSTSPNYHQWLEPTDIGERFGPAQSDIDAISNWLASHRLSVDEVANDKMSIRFSGTAAQVEEAFHTEIHNLSVKGESHIANMTDPQIPAALAPAVVGVKALHNFFPKPQHRLGSLVQRDAETGGWKRAPVPVEDRPKTIGKVDTDLAKDARPRSEFTINVPSSSSTNAYIEEDVVPYDFATIYNVLPLWNASKPIVGTGQVIAITGTSRIEASDVATFRSTFGLPALSASTSTPPYLKQVVANGTDPGVCTSTSSTATCTIDDLVENSLDVEWSGAVAKNASVVLVVSGSNSQTTDTVYSSANYIVQNKVANIMNVSYGFCELGLGTAGNTQYNSLWQTAAAEGISVFVSTGDSGSASCDQGDGALSAAEYGLAVSGISSTPYDTAVGGTDFNWCSLTASSCTSAPYWNTSNNTTTKASAKNYVPELPWNDSCASGPGAAFLEYFANQVGVSGVSNSEYACNFVADYYQAIYDQYGIDLTPFLDSVGGTGGKSACTTSDGSTPSSCTGGYAKPSWQAGVSGIPVDGKRDVPDVSFFASDGFLSDSAYLICVSAVGSCTYTTNVEPTEQEVGGTSVASPAMAGVMALINQKAGGPQGLANPELYKLASKQSYGSCKAENASVSNGCYFNDIDESNIAQPCDEGDFGYVSPNCTLLDSSDGIGILSGYSATAGFDLANGLGSLNVANVVNAWPAATTPSATLSVTQLTFPTTVVGSSSATQSVTLKNGGTGALTISSISVPASFTETNTCGTSLAAGSSCAITVTFKPQAAGAIKGSLVVTDNATGSPQSVALSGTGQAAAPGITLTPTSLTFAATPVGTSATGKVITIKNNGTGILDFTSVVLKGADVSSFTLTKECSSTLAAGASCTMTVGFKPAASGTLTASLSFTDNAASGSTQSIAITGTGTSPKLTFSASSLAFAATPVGTAAKSQVLTLKNAGTEALSITGIAVTGTNESSFSITKTCGSNLAVSASCTVTVTFKPAATGALKAEVRVTDNSTGSPQYIPLTGTGAAPVATLSHTQLTFASTVVGKSATAQTVQLTNSGNAPLTLTGTGLGISIYGGNTTSFSQTNNCGTSLAAGAKCTINVTFTPKSAGTLTSALRFGDNAAESPQKLTLTGTGTAASAK